MSAISCGRCSCEAAAMAQSKAFFLVQPWAIASLKFLRAASLSCANEFPIPMLYMISAIRVSAGALIPPFANTGLLGRVVQSSQAFTAPGQSSASQRNRAALLKSLQWFTTCFTMSLEYLVFTFPFESVMVSRGRAFEKQSKPSIMDEPICFLLTSLPICANTLCWS